MNEKRKHSRVDSIYLLNYVHLDENDNAMMQGMGRTINVSESGIMLETHVSFGENDTVDVVVGLKEDMVTIRGKVVFARATETGRYQSGIQFLTIEDASLETLRRYIDAFNAFSANA
ncbi:MAG: PilZ domain-containing protein [Desulfosarcina sp.]|nr:PilZ domain-containing protein [Desulfosarcina sp.]MBC2741967.1 PilZ domain-containing protein [Desulfosarcina sp.]MBC2764880.1 PilZ domain-containing protein [Desulfosarcina sp.]